MSRIRVIKFGGTSMGSVESLKCVYGIISDNSKNKIGSVVICSAMSKTTDNLIRIGNQAKSNGKRRAIEILEEIKIRHFEVAKYFDVFLSFKEDSEPLFNEIEELISGISIIKEFSSRSYAYFLSFGERLSTRLLTSILNSKHISAEQCDSTIIRTKGISFIDDMVDIEESQKMIQEKILPIIESGKIPIITGFFGNCSEGDIRLLGRGGSDFSAAIIALGLKQKSVEIWTDVDGFMSADPRVVKEAKVIPKIGYREASELCFFGAKVLHPRTIRPVIDKGGEVWIKNTFNSSFPGTLIVKRNSMPGKSAISISTKRVLVFSMDVFGSSKRKSEIFSMLFNVAHDHKIPIDMIASSEALISFCIEEKFESDKSFIEKVKKLGPIKLAKNKNIVCIVSPENIIGVKGIATQIFKAVSDVEVSIEMYSQNASEIAQLIVVDSKDVDTAIKSIHKQCIEVNEFSETNI